MQADVDNGSWGERFLGATRGRILSLLRTGSKTVNELSIALEMTDNGIRAHLTTLERDGLIRRRGVRRGFRKPEQIFELTDDAGQFFPRAHELLLAQLVVVLKDRDVDSAREILQEVGRRIAAGYTTGLANADVQTRTSTALKALADIGGVVELSTTGAVSVIQGAGCPLAALTRLHPEVCSLAQSLLADILGTAVDERCERGDHPRCRFTFSQRLA